ncbi:hypothetical protein GPY23_23235 [Photorhabdus bodei]|uniref:Uncharacterized protein n=1 Tax=Photorhabdus bodei TaxID=2029681 RepID=A0ABX0AS75_9GAMM|nr:hypothetical protein [Photorhabdus bodei]NDL05930.1 hypothetical protein [Photorhabdus bodei]NDL10179.1 hypothetical protein [Photorhabdus bodei]
MDFKMHRDGIANDMTGMSECSQQRGNLKDNGYIKFYYHRSPLALSVI